MKKVLTAKSFVKEFKRLLYKYEASAGIKSKIIPNEKLSNMDISLVIQLGCCGETVSYDFTEDRQ